MFSRHLFVKTNQSCNLRCVYCYEKEKGSVVFDEEKTFLRILRILRTPTPNGSKIKLIGGEPFLVFDKIRKFCERILDEHLEEKIHFQITTNGTLVHGDIQKWLNDHKEVIDCKLSLDGNRTSQNLNRPNSFDLIDVDFFAKTWENCTVNMVVTPETLPYFADNVIYLHSRSLGQIVPIFAVLTDWTNCDLQKCYYEQLMHLADYYVGHPNVHRCHNLNLHLERVLSKSDEIICDIGKKIIYDVDTERYYPCHLFFPSVCGENHPRNMESIDFSTRSSFEYYPCRSCVFINICHTCYAANFIERGSLGKRDMSICEYRKIDFLVNAKLEYHRIINSKNSSSKDYQIMIVIKKLLQEFKQIESNYTI